MGVAIMEIKELFKKATAVCLAGAITGIAVFTDISSPASGPRKAHAESTSAPARGKPGYDEWARKEKANEKAVRDEIFRLREQQRKLREKEKELLGKEKEQQKKSPAQRKPDETGYFLPRLTGVPEITYTDANRVRVHFKIIDEGKGGSSDPLGRGNIEIYMDKRNMVLRFRLNMSTNSGTRLDATGLIDQGIPGELKGRTAARDGNNEKFGSASPAVSQLGSRVAEIVETIARIETPDGPIWVVGEREMRKQQKGLEKKPLLPFRLGF